MTTINLDELQKGYFVDGQVFETKADVEEYARKDIVTGAIKKLVKDVKNADWLYENRKAITACFKLDPIKQVAKEDREELQNGLNNAIAMVNAAELDKIAMKKFEFLIANADQLVKSFKWPTVKRLSKEEQAVKSAEMLTAIEGSNDALVAWLSTNSSSIVDAFNTGKVKRKVSDGALEGLAKYKLEVAKQKFEEGENITIKQAEILKAEGIEVPKERQYDPEAKK